MCFSKVSNAAKIKTVNFMNKTESSDIVVIGAGAVGTAIASYLAEDGHSVALVEQGECAWGTSRRCEGYIVTYDTVPGYYSQVSALGQKMLRDLAPNLDYDVHLQPTGLGLLVDNEADMESLFKHAKGKQDENVDCEIWDRKELLDNEPHIGEKVSACLFFKNEFSVNPMRLAYAFAHNAKKHKAKIFTHTKVTNINIKNNVVQSVETNKGTIHTKKIIIAAGAWSNLLCDMAQVNIPVRPRQGMLLVMERTKNFINTNYCEYGYVAAKSGNKRPSATPLMEELGVASTFEPTLDGTLLVGSSRRFAGFDMNPSPDVVQAIAQRAMTFFPKLGSLRLLRTYCGLRPYSPDGLPIMSNTHIDGLFLATGHEGNGISLSALSGKVMAQMIANEESIIDMAPLHIDRFKLNPLSKGFNE